MEIKDVVIEEEEVVQKEASAESMRAMAEMRRDAYTQLVSIHLQNLTRIMMSTNGTTQLQKRQANKALIEAVEFALNFGIKENNTIRDKGVVLAKETNNLAGVLVQALDNRMLLLADNMRRQQEQDAQQEIAESQTEKQLQEEVKQIFEETI